MIDMRRRDFITLLGGGAATWPLVARAQVAKVWRIGYLAESRRQVDEIFRQSLRRLGYIEGFNLTMIYRWGAGGGMRSQCRWRAGWLRSTHGCTRIA